jgi:hypothetical protein
MQQAAQRLQAQPVSDEEAYAWIGAALEGGTAVGLRARDEVRRRAQPAALEAGERAGVARQPDEAAEALFGLTRASAVAVGQEAVRATGVLDEVLQAVCQALRTGQPVTEALAGAASRSWRCCRRRRRRRWWLRGWWHWCSTGYGRAGVRTGLANRCRLSRSSRGE